MPKTQKNENYEGETSDLAAIAAAKNNPEAFALLYDKYLTPVYRYFLVRVSHVETAEDLSSQTFLQAFKAFARYEPRGQIFGTWLFTIAHNILVNNYRKPSTRALDEAGDLASGQNIENEVAGQLAREQLRALLNSLNMRDREIVTLRSADDLSFLQIAEVLQISETAARTAYHRAVQKLASIYQEKMKYPSNNTSDISCLPAGRAVNLNS